MKVLEKLREPNKQLRLPVQEIGDGDMRGTILLGNIMRPRKEKNTATVKVFAEIVNSFFFPKMSSVQWYQTKIIWLRGILLNAFKMIIRCLINSKFLKNSFTVQ